MSEHTKGPWQIHDEDLRGGKYWCVRASGLEEFLAEIHDDDNGEANARLIAAAPDMLEALERCLAYIERDETTHGRNFAEGNVARAAIAKARGEP